MNINFRALAFGTAVAAALTVTMNTLAAEAPAPVVRLEGITVIAHRDAPIATDTVEVVRLDPVLVTAHKAAV